MRIQIELPEGDVTTLKNLMADANIETYKDLFKNALLLLYWAVREVKNGRIIASVRGEEVDQSDISCKQIVMPILERLGEAKDQTKQQFIRFDQEIPAQAVIKVEKDLYKGHIRETTKAIGKKIEP